MIMVYRLKEIWPHSVLKCGFEPTFQEQGTSCGCSLQHICVCDPFPACALCNIKSSWVVKALVEIAVLSWSVAKWKPLMQRRERVLPRNVLWPGNQVAHLSYGCYCSDVPMTWSKNMDWDVLPLIPCFRDTWGRAALPSECFYALYSVWIQSHISSTP